MEPLLTSLVNERNLAYKSFLKHQSDEIHQRLIATRKALLREKRRAKRQWQFAYAKKYKKEDFASNPKEAWNMIFKLIEAFQGRHKTYMPKNFKTKSGKEAKCDTENAQILNEHFTLFLIVRQGTKQSKLSFTSQDL
jgi:hypothetical protein